MTNLKGWLEICGKGSVEAGESSYDKNKNSAEADKDQHSWCKDVKGLAIPAKEWLALWQEGIPAANEFQSQIKVDLNSDQCKQMLEANHVVFLADRIVNGLVLLYGAAQLEDDILFLMELKFEAQNCFLSTKTFATHLTRAFHQSVQELLNH